MKRTDAKGDRTKCHLKDIATKVYQNKGHAVHHILISSGCSVKDAKKITKLALDYVKD